MWSHPHPTTSAKHSPSNESPRSPTSSIPPSQLAFENILESTMKVFGQKSLIVSFSLEYPSPFHRLSRYLPLTPGKDRLTIEPSREARPPLAKTEQTPQ